MAAVSDRMLIGGTRPAVVADRSIEVVDPFTGGLIARVSDASATEVAEAVTAAQTAFDATWRTTSGADRAGLMIRLAELIERDVDELGRIESRDNGKLLRETTTQARFSARNYRFFAGLADKITGRTIPLDSRATFDYTVREPVGVAALDHRMELAAAAARQQARPRACRRLHGRRQAQRAGSVVHTAPRRSRRRGRLSRRRGEHGHRRRDSGAAMTSDPRLGRISFTGSVATGQAIPPRRRRRSCP